MFRGQTWPLVGDFDYGLALSLRGAYDDVGLRRRVMHRIVHNVLQRLAEVHWQSEWFLSFQKGVVFGKVAA